MKKLQYLITMYFLRTQDARLEFRNNHKTLLRKNTVLDLVAKIIQITCEELQFSLETLKKPSVLAKIILFT